MKKTVLLFILCACCLSLFSQQKRKWRGSYLLTGSIENIVSGKAILTYDDITKKGVEKKVMEGGVANGKFAFSAYLEEPALVTLKIEDKEYQFYVDPTTVEVKIDSNDNITVTGSWTNDDKIKIEQLEERINSLREGNKNPQGNFAELSYASIERNSFVVLKKMGEVANPEHPFHSTSVNHQMINILMAMSEDLKETPSGIKISGMLFLLSVKMHAAPIN